MADLFFKTRYSKNRNVLPQFEWSDDNPCLQDIKELTDINLIYKQYCKGIEPVRHNVNYGDTTLFPQSYSDAKQLINQVESDFFSLPAEVRSKFNNRVDDYVAAFGDKTRLKDFAHLGIHIEHPSSVDVSALSRPQFAETTQKAEQAGQQVNNNADFVGDK